MGAKTAQTSGTSNGTSTTTLAPNVQAAYNSLLSQFGGLANTSQGNPAVSNSVSGLTNLAANDNPAFGQAASDISGSLNPAYNTVGNYLSPYLNDALSAQVGLENTQNQQQQQGLVGNAIANGSFGGNRVGLAQSALAGQQQLANNATNSGLINSAYQQALTAAQQQQSLGQSAGAGLTNVGTSQNQASLANLLGLLSGGQFQQTAPYSNLSSLSGAVSGLSNAGATTSTSGNTTGTVPVGNGLSSILGGITSIAGLFAGGGRVGFDTGGVTDQMAQERNQGASQAMQDSQNIITSMMANEQQQQQADQQSMQSVLSSPQTKAGIGVIKGLFNPVNDNNVPDASGRNTYAVGGLVGRRGYDDGGYVDPFGYNIFAPITDPGATASALSNYRAAPSVSTPVVMPPSTPDIGSTGAALSGFGGGSPPPGVGGGLVAPPQPPLPASPPSDGSNVVPFVPRATSPAPSGLVASIDQTGPVPLAPQRNIPPIDTSPASANIGIPAAPTGLVAAPAPSGHVPLSVANNNPGNITASPWTAKQPGYIGNNGDFAVFANPTAGRNAQISLLGTYAASGNDTIASMVSKWAPQAANLKTPGSTQNYINYVSQKLGISPNAPVPPSMFPAMADAMGEVESGRRGAATGSPATYGIAPQTGASATNAPPQPSGLIAGNMGEPAITAPVVSGVVQPPSGYGVPDSNAGYATNIQDVLSSLSKGKGLDLSPDARMALISAGAGMMAGTSPNAFANIGSGIQQGVDTWQKKQVLNRENDIANSSIAAQQGSLGLQGQEVQQAGQTLYNQMQEVKAQIAALTASAGATNVGATRQAWVAGPFGLMHYDANNPSAPPTVTPYNQIVPNATGAAAEQPKPDASGFITTAPPATTVNPLLMSPESANIVYDQSKTVLGGAQGDAVNAQGLNAQVTELANLAKNLPDSGPLAMGAGYNQRVDAVKGINGFLTTMGVAPIDPENVATAEGMKKLATQLQFSVADAVKSDPAAATIAQAASASPSGENTAQGFNRIIGNIQALNKRSIDRYSFVQDWANKHYGDTSGADVAFNQANPPQKYVQFGENLTNNLNNPPGTQANPVVPASQSDIDNAPSGTVFKVNGQLMRKP